MSVFNRRNAAVGWFTVFVGKRVLKRKAKQALTKLEPGSKKPNKQAVALLMASVAGLATFWRRRSDNEETE